MNIAIACLRRALLPILGLTLHTTKPGLSAEVRIESENSRVRLIWPAAVDVPGRGLVWPEYTVSRSGNLADWTPVPGKLRGISGRSGAWLNLIFDMRADAEFFRVTPGSNATGQGQLGAGGEEVFGYGDRFAEELERLGLMSLDQFAASAPPPAYSAQLTFEPSVAEFWTNFNGNEAFRLNAAELARFRVNGFVVSERLGEESFGALYYRIFHGDLPVFVTADSVLQAWHRTYLGMLEELEEIELATLVEQVMTNLPVQLPSFWREFGAGPLRESILDADYFLTVARSLWTGSQAAPALAVTGQPRRVTDTLAAINGLEAGETPLFGSNRWIDFSQFTIRGHYANSERLKRYFRTMMWCSRTDLRLVAFEPNREDDIRQLGTALVLHELLRQSSQSNHWSAVEQVTSAFVGATDSMTFQQLGGLLARAGIASLAEVADRGALTNLQTRLLTGELGVQSITSDRFFSPLSPAELKLPRSFTVFGQKFVLDSWALSQVVFDKIHGPPGNTAVSCGSTNIEGKVVRRKPSCLDVAFSVLANDQVAPEIIRLIQRANGVPFRDGLPYQQNLAAVRAVVDRQAAEGWTNTIYTAWLAALRSLSAPTTGPDYPEAMRTRAWGMKTLNTQLASWAELRHDTVLYAKPSYTPPVVCSYPCGFVEPRPEFWRAMKDLADVAASGISRLPVPFKNITIPGRPPGAQDYDPAPPITCELAVVKQSQLMALRNFSSTMTRLETMARKELNQQPLTVEENEFLKSIMEYRGICHSGQLGYTGWYPALFYQNVFWTNLGSTDNNDSFHNRQGCSMFDALVTDVHTDVPDPVVCDPGAVIHEAVGKAHLLMIAVDNGPDRRVYAGPVFSHYELEVPGANRMSDQEWQATLTAGIKPASPEWTRGFLAPTGWGYDDIVPPPNVAAWGVNDFGQLKVPDDLTNAVHIGGHGLTSLAVRENGIVAAWGRNAFGETRIPEGLSNVVTVSGHVGISMALKVDGTVTAWGDLTITNVPAGLSNAVAVDATAQRAIAVREDGTVVAWGNTASNVPPDLARIVAVALGPAHGLALKDDGTVLAWGDPYGGRNGEGSVPPGLSNVVAIAAGMSHSLALLGDGTVVGWGSDLFGQISIFQGVSNLVAVAAGYSHSVGLKADGTVISSAGWAGVAGAIPLSLSNVVEIAAGGDYTLALVGKAAPLTLVPLIDPRYGTEDFTASIKSQYGRVYRLEYASSPESREWRGLRLVAGTGRMLMLRDSAAAGQPRAYRVRCW